MVTNAVPVAAAAVASIVVAAGCNVVVVSEIVLECNSDTCDEKPLVQCAVRACCVDAHITISTKKSAILQAEEISSLLLCETTKRKTRASRKSQV